MINKTLHIEMLVFLSAVDNLICTEQIQTIIAFRCVSVLSKTALKFSYLFTIHFYKYKKLFYTIC